jgi:hypothetical protein
MSDCSSLEEHSMLLQDSSRFSDRRQITSDMCVAVNSLLLTASGVLSRDLAA